MSFYHIGNKRRCALNWLCLADNFSCTRWDVIFTPHFHFYPFSLRTNHSSFLTSITIQHLICTYNQALKCRHCRPISSNAQVDNRFRNLIYAQPVELHQWEKYPLNGEIAKHQRNLFTKSRENQRGQRARRHLLPCHWIRVRSYLYKISALGARRRELFRSAFSSPPSFGIVLRAR